MYFTYFIIFWTFGTFSVKSQIYPKAINYYEPISGPSILKPSKPYSGLWEINQNNSQDNFLTKRTRNNFPKKFPQKQRFVLYYPPPKTYHYPYADRFKNFYKNPGFHNYNYFMNYQQPKNQINSNIIKDNYIGNNNNNNNVQNLLKLEEAILRPEIVAPQLENGESRVKFQKEENDKLYLKKPFYARVPNQYMEPPGFATSDYKNYEKRKNLPSNKKNELYKNHNFYKNHQISDSVKSSNDKAPYVRDHAPENDTEESSENETVESKEEQFPKKISSASEISPDGDRVEFQIQGHEGPRTYLFGYDTGEGSNRQYRLEEKLKDGTVKGQYGYYDARGKLRAIKYVARPEEGYEEKHHESFVPDDSSDQEE